MIHRHCTIDGIGIYKNFLRNVDGSYPLQKLHFISDKILTCKMNVEYKNEQETGDKEE